VNSYRIKNNYENKCLLQNEDDGKLSL